MLRFRRSYVHIFKNRIVAAKNKHKFSTDLAFAKKERSKYQKSVWYKRTKKILAGSKIKKTEYIDKRRQLPEIKQVVEEVYYCVDFLNVIMPCMAKLKKYINPKILENSYKKSLVPLLKSLPSSSGYKLLVGKYMLIAEFRTNPAMFVEHMYKVLLAEGIDISKIIVVICNSKISGKEADDRFMVKLSNTVRNIVLISNDKLRSMEKHIGDDIHCQVFTGDIIKNVPVVQLENESRETREEKALSTDSYMFDIKLEQELPKFLLPVESNNGKYVFVPGDSMKLADGDLNQVYYRIFGSRDKKMVKFFLP